MKKIAGILLISAILALACTEKKAAEPSGIPAEAVADIIESLTPQPYDYVGNKVLAVISPDRKHAYILESEKQWAMEGLKAKVIDLFRWEIQVNEEPRSIAFVTFVKAQDEFSAAFPYLIANIATGIKGICNPRDKCISPNTLETAKCELVKGTYVKNVISSYYCECDTSKAGACFQIDAMVGTQYFFGDNSDCSKKPIGHGDIWKPTCLYDKNNTL